MKILFVMEHRGNAGNTHAVANFVRAGADHGHTVAVYGPPQANLPSLPFTTDAGAFDSVVYLFESKLHFIERLRQVALLAETPRRRRFVFDSDGMYNPVLVMDGGDCNHRNEAERAEWLRTYDALSDRVLQPALAPPSDRRVRRALFYGYNPAQCVAASSSRRGGPATVPKRYDILHVGHNWWRGREVARELLPALERVRDRVGAIGFVGLWWDGAPPWARQSGMEPAFWVDTEAFRRLRIEIAPAVPYTEVIATMSAARVNILTQRPVLRHLKHLTLKYFEVFCADTIPLLMFDADHAEAIYGPAGRELALAGRVAEKLLDALGRPDYYREVVAAVRRHLLAHHSYGARMAELAAALRS